MPSKNKKGKASKFARMSDEERARYLQHRAELELEAKRRQQQLIAGFIKNKLKREEAFARINTAKLNEQWRITLRQINCANIKENIEYMWYNFEEVLQSKGSLIKKLLNGLVEVDSDHKRFQQAHMIIIDSIIEKGRERINYLYNNYNEHVNTIRSIDMEELRNRKDNKEEFLQNLKTIIVAKNKKAEEEITDLKTKHAIRIYGISYDKSELILNLKREICFIMENLWRQLNDTITNYENSTENIRKQYDCLKKQDDVYQTEITRFPKCYAKLKKEAETLSKTLVTLAQEREETIENLNIQSEMLTKRVCKLRQEMKMAQTVDAVQLKRLAVTSNKAIKDLQRIVDKSIELQTITKLCSDIKLDSFHVKMYTIQYFKEYKQLIKFKDEPGDFFKKIQGFRDHMYNVKEENNLLKKQRDNLIEENNRLTHCLRIYLVTASRMPTISSI